MDTSNNNLTSSIEKCNKCDKYQESDSSSSSSSSSSNSSITIQYNSTNVGTSNNNNTFIKEFTQLKDKKSKISLSSLGLNLRRVRSKRSSIIKKSNNQQTTTTTTTINNNNKEITKKNPKWNIKFNYTKKDTKNTFNHQDNINNCCKCKCLKLDKRNIERATVLNNSSNDDKHINKMNFNTPLHDLNEYSVVESDLNEVTNTGIIRNRNTETNNNNNNNNNNTNNDNNNKNNSIIDNNHDEIIHSDGGGVRGIYGVNNNSNGILISAPFFDLQWMLADHEDCDEAARLARAREIEQGVEAPANFRPMRRVQLLCSDMEAESGQIPRRLQLVCPPGLSVDSLRALFQNKVTLRSCPLDTITGCHTQVDFIHCLVPDLLEITKCSFYWGKMDRYEAERLLDGKPEGTFLLRDSAQEEYLFSVSFRKYDRSLHARIEQWNHKFSFDSHDPGVYTSNTVCGLIEHYKDPSSVMFFEPILTWPLHRNVTFSLQHLCRSVIVSRLTYDNINLLPLPKTLKTYLKEYHYRQKVRVENFDDDIQWLELGNS